MKEDIITDGINVLSLFDGISCGQVALERANIEVNNYFASEINDKSIAVANKNYPDTIQLGDVRHIDVHQLPNIDLLMGGSPCQGFSFAGRKLNFEDPRSRLFFDFARIKKEINPKYFLLENVKMKKEYRDIISDILGVESIVINSSLMSAQNRVRLYWTNIPNVRQPEDKGITLGDIIYDDTYKVFTDARITKTKRVTKNYVKWDMSGKQHWSQQDRAYFKEKKMCALPRSRPASKLNIVLDYDKDIYRRIHPIEAERCQTLPDRYTQVEGVSNNQRLEIIGDGWTVDIISHILKNLKQRGVQ